MYTMSKKYLALGEGKEVKRPTWFWCGTSDPCRRERLLEVMIGKMKLVRDEMIGKSWRERERM